MKDKHPFVSVIIPVYNTEKYLCECVDSILNQSHRNLEVILVDDGSVDNSPGICDNYARKDYRVKVIHKPNGGLSSARNAGLDSATGDWIMFTDSDDLCDTNMVENLLLAVVLCDAPLAICSTYYLDKGYKCAIDPSKENGGIEKTSSHGILNNLWKSEYDNNLFTSSCNKLFDRCFFSEILRFREGIICEDDDLCNRLYVEDYPVAVVHKPLYYWRMNPVSISHQPFSEKRAIMLKILEDRVAMFSGLKWKAQVLNTAKVCCELYIEYYFKAFDQGHVEWVTQYKDSYCTMRKVCYEIQTMKDRIRYHVFDIFPKLYRKYILKK